MEKEEFYNPLFDLDKKVYPNKSILPIPEINILSLINNVETDHALQFLKKHLQYPEKSIEKIISSLEEKKLIKKISLNHGKRRINKYKYTRNVNNSMLNQDLRFQKEMKSYLNKLLNKHGKEN